MVLADDGSLGIGTATPSYPLEVNGESGSGISIYASGDISGEDIIDRTSIYDKSRGSALSFIKDADDYLSNGEIDHKKFYSYAGEFEVTDYDRPEEVAGDCLDESDEETTCNVTIYPYIKAVEGISMSNGMSVLRQATYELKTENQMLKTELCAKDNSYSWC